MMPEDRDRLMTFIAPMLHNRLDNYIVAGLNSSMVGDQGNDHGKVRLFHADRDTRDEITPHSHRFDFACLVLEGRVVNTLYTETEDESGVPWCRSSIDQVCGVDGLRQYKHTREDEPRFYTAQASMYGPGNTYSMETHEIHSITFSRGARVLFFEGPQVCVRSHMIEPWVNGKCVPTFRTEPWMFEKGYGA